MKLKLTFPFLFFCSIITAQEEVLRIENNLKTSKDKIDQTYTIVNESNSSLAVFLKDKNYTYGYLFDENFNQLSELKSENLEKKYKEFLGTSISDNNYNLFISNTKHSMFGMVSFSFDNQHTTITEIDLDISDETFLQSISHKNKFYILSATKNGLNLYLFGKDGNYEIKSFDFVDEKFFNQKNNLATLNYSLSGASNIPKSHEIQIIQDSHPNSIEGTSERIKLYVKDNLITITIDNISSYTQLLQINLENLKSDVVNIKKPYLYSNDPLFIKSNSFIYDDKILQVVSTSNDFAFSIKDIEADRLIKEYRIKDSDSITFKNSPIIQEGGTYDNYREMEKTKKFLRKITAQKIGVSAYKINNSHQITLGGIKEIKSGGMTMPGFGAFPVGNFGGVNVFFNPTMFAFNAYQNTVSTYINCLFDNNYEHIEGEIKDNVFDKITDFKEDKKQFINAETIFSYNGSMYFGSCLGDSLEYIIMKFND